MMKRLPHPLVSAIPLVVLIGLLAMVIALFGSDSLSGGSQVSLLAAMAVCVFISMVFYREPWKSFEQQIEKTVGGVATIAYLPYCFFNILSPLMTILVAALGWKIKNRRDVS